MRGQTEGSHEEINVEEAIRIHGNMVYRLALVQMKNKSEAVCIVPVTDGRCVSGSVPPISKV